MMILFLAGATIAYWQEAAGNPILHQLGVARRQYGRQGGPLRHRRLRPVLVVTTAASCGAVNAMHDSFTALGGMIPLFNMQLGEVVIGGVGAGIYGFLLFAILAVFVAGLMVGRTPEYVGKKIEGREVKLAVLAIAVLPLIILGFTAHRLGAAEAGLAGPLNKGPHGFSEILYAFTSARREQWLGLCRPDRQHALLQRLARRRDVDRPLLHHRARCWPSPAAWRRRSTRPRPPAPSRPPARSGSACWSAIILILGGLTFLPSLALGPIADHLAMIRGQLF